MRFSFTAAAILATGGLAGKHGRHRRQHHTAGGARAYSSAQPNVDVPVGNVDGAQAANSGQTVSPVAEVVEDTTLASTCNKLKESFDFNQIHELMANLKNGPALIKKLNEMVDQEDADKSKLEILECLNFAEIVSAQTEKIVRSKYHDEGACEGCLLYWLEQFSPTAVSSLCSTNAPICQEFMDVLFVREMKRDVIRGLERRTCYAQWKLSGFPHSSLEGSESPQYEFMKLHSRDFSQSLKQKLEKIISTRSPIDDDLQYSVFDVLWQFRSQEWEILNEIDPDQSLLILAINAATVVVQNAEQFAEQTSLFWTLFILHEIFLRDVRDVSPSTTSLAEEYYAAWWKAVSVADNPETHEALADAFRGAIIYHYLVFLPENIDGIPGIHNREDAMQHHEYVLQILLLRNEVRRLIAGRSFSIVIETCNLPISTPVIDVLRFINVPELLIYLTNRMRQNFRATYLQREFVTEIFSKRRSTLLEAEFAESVGPFLDIVQQTDTNWYNWLVPAELVEEVPMPAELVEE